VFQRPEFHRPPVDGVHVDRDVRAQMRDGIELYADVYRPDDGPGQRYRVLLAIAPYQKDIANALTTRAPGMSAALRSVPV
jgi:predicted acyl esterase